MLNHQQLLNELRALQINKTIFDKIELLVVLHKQLNAECETAVNAAVKYKLLYEELLYDQKLQSTPEVPPAKPSTSPSTSPSQSPTEKKNSYARSK